MKNQDQENPLHIHMDVMANIKKHFTRNEYSYIKKLITYINKNCEIAVDNIPLDASDLKTLLGISKRSASRLRNKLIMHDIMVITLRSIDNRFVQTMILSYHLAFIKGYSCSTIFEDISTGLKPLPKKLKPTI